MIRGLYTSALGMTTQMKKMDVVSNNIANVNTTGFKRDLVVTRTFSDELASRLDDPGDTRHSRKIGPLNLGIFVDDVYSDFSNGGFVKTDGKLDVGIDGTGYFAIQVTDKNGNTTEKYTRDGSFTLGSDGVLLTKEGNRVAGSSGNIVIPDGSVSISETGDVYSNGEYIDTIKMVDFTDLHTLRKVGDNLYDVTEDTVQKDFSGVLQQGYLENSNVSSVKEMVEMITLSRAYEANQKMILTHDTILGKAVTDIGRK